MRIKMKNRFLIILMTVLSFFCFVFGVGAYNRTVKANAAAPTLVSELFLGSWAASASTNARLFINAASNNMPTTVVDMVWTGAGGSKSQFGEGLLNNGVASGVRSVTYTTDCFYIDVDGATPFATEGHTIVVPGNKIFTVNSVDYGNIF